MLGSTLSAQSSMVNTINNWLEQGEYAGVLNNMSDEVSCTILGKNYTRKTDAGKALETVFKGKEVEKYTLMHSGENGNSTFMIARIDIGGQSYRINLLLTESKIVELRIE